MTAAAPRQVTAFTVTISGLEARLVRVEVDTGRGLPAFHLVGLPEASIRESRTRVRAALRHLGIDLNEYAITVNLAPADLRKGGSSFDLAIAVGILAALYRLPLEPLGRFVCMGELSLAGEIGGVSGVLPSLMAARAQGFHEAIVPLPNGAEAAAVDGIETWTATRLDAVVAHLTGERALPRAIESPPADGDRHRTVDFAEVRGQTGARRALEIAAAGEHNLLMFGPPGAGKTMLARRLPTILPPMTIEESLTVTSIHSVAGLLHEHGLIRERPFRAPHHTLSAAALFGGGWPLRPGEISLAHHGCLFLDELPEFRRHVLEGMRQPLEDGVVTICRARQRAVFPARPLLIAAVNPCPCGYHGISQRCRCSNEQVQRYRARLSGPLLDRIDLHVPLPALSLDDLQDLAPGEPSGAIRERVIAARRRQHERAEVKETSTPYNATLTAADLDRVAPLCDRSKKLLRQAAESRGLSARGYVKVRRVARTIADLEGSATVTPGHLSEALTTRALDHRSGSAFAMVG